jgi:hypothetical protein
VKILTSVRATLASFFCVAVVAGVMSASTTASAQCDGGAANFQMQYHGGTVLQNPEIYVVFWGPWPTYWDGGAATLLDGGNADPMGEVGDITNLIPALGGTRYLEGTSQYTGTALLSDGGTGPSGPVGTLPNSIAGIYYDNPGSSGISPINNYGNGSQVSDYAGIARKNFFSSITNPDAIIVIMVSVTAGSDTQTGACSVHGFDEYNGPFIWIPYQYNYTTNNYQVPANTSEYGYEPCYPTPGNLNASATAALLSEDFLHELVESLTDPRLNAWITCPTGSGIFVQGLEAADLCTPANNPNFLPTGIDFESEPQVQAETPSATYPTTLSPYTLYPHANYTSGTQVCASEWQDQAVAIGTTSAGQWEAAYQDPLFPSSSYDYGSWGGEWGPGSVFWGPGSGREDVFGITSSGTMAQVYTIAGWGSYSTGNLGSSFIVNSRTAASSWGNGEIDVFGLYSDYSFLLHRNIIYLSWNEYYSTSWAGWTHVSSPSSTNLATYGVGSTASLAGVTDVYALGADGNLWENTNITLFDLGFQGWSNLSNNGWTLTGAPSVTSWDNYRQDLVIRDSSGTIRHGYVSGSNGTFTWDTWPGAMPTSGGTTIYAASDPTVVALGYERLLIDFLGTDGNIWQYVWDGTQGTSSWTAISQLPSTVGGPTAASW